MTDLLKNKWTSIKFLKMGFMKGKYNHILEVVKLILSRGLTYT